mmetsp:Transcript_16629/g.27560  ORF Transcript_16629/g.27560 Transcript_16629/m.27560 type:complete len:106 (+) Transcript_16629:81-398(+)
MCISAAVTIFFLWEDLGRDGADGRAFLVSAAVGTKGAVGVLNFFFTDPETKARHEASIWKQFYLHLPRWLQVFELCKLWDRQHYWCPGFNGLSELCQIWKRWSRR